MASEMCSLSQQVQESEGSRWPGGTWTSAAGSANMEVSSAGKANREPELSCKTCLKRTLKRATNLRHPY